MPSAAIGIVLNPERTQVLLVKRQDVPIWVLPGGGVDAGETPEEAILRETLEETGLAVKILRKTGEYSPINRLALDTYIFECIPVIGTETLLTGSETKEIGYFALNDLPKDFFFVHNDWLQDALKSENRQIVLHKKITQVTYVNLVKYFIKHPWIVVRFLMTRLGVK